MIFWLRVLTVEVEGAMEICRAEVLTVAEALLDVTVVELKVAVAVAVFVTLPSVMSVPVMV